jgi:hypothetical protein
MATPSSPEQQSLTPGGRRPRLPRKWSFFIVVAAAFGFTAPLLAQQQKVASHYAVNDPHVPATVRAIAQTEPWQHAEAGPVDDLRVYARERAGAVWLGSREGAARFDAQARSRWDRWQYFHGRRWLLDNEVQQIVVQETGPVRQIWIRTQTGVTCLEWQPMTLEEKARAFEERIEARHVRHGLVADSHLRVAGDLSSNVKRSSDNDGLWTAMYLGAQAYRYAATKAPEARARARRALDALMRLEAITGIPGFYARSFIHRDEAQPADGEWHPTPDGQWRWKGDTSSDESVGHYYAYGLYFDLVADAAEQEAIRRVARRMTDYLIRNNYDLPDVDGQPTRWGQWSERYLQTEEGQYEAPLRCLELLSFLKTTFHITGDPQYQAAYEERVARGYARHVPFYRRWPQGGEINFSDDELAYLSYAPLLQYESDRNLRRIYLDGLRFTWRQIRPDHNPLWNYISVASGAGPMTAAVRRESRQTLERIPLDLVEWTVINSHRRDLTWSYELDRAHRRQLTRVLAPDERPISKWNGNPYLPDGGSGGHGEDDGAYFLLPYWIGRYYGWVD